MASNTDDIKSLLTELNQQISTLQTFLQDYDIKEILQVFSRLELNVHSLMEKICMLKNEKEQFTSNLKKKLLDLINMMKEANKCKKDFQEHTKTKLQSIMKAAGGVVDTVIDFNIRIRKKMDALNKEIEKSTSLVEEIDEGLEEISAMMSSLMILIKKNTDV